MAELKQIDVKFISLVGKGANRRKLIWKSFGKDGIQRTVRIAKTNDEEQMAYCPVMVPGEVDTQGDTISKAEVRAALHRFMKNSRTGSGVDVHHSFEIEDGAAVVESWEVRKGGPEFGDEPEGTWVAGIHIENSDLWEKIKSKEITGFSIGGTAVHEEVAKADMYNDVKIISDLWNKTSILGDSIRSIVSDENITDNAAKISETIDQFKSELINEITSEQTTEEVEMTKEEIAQIVKSETSALVTVDIMKQVIAEVMKQSLEGIADRIEKLEGQSFGSVQKQDAPLDGQVDHKQLAREIIEKSQFGGKK